MIIVNYSPKVFADSYSLVSWRCFAVSYDKQIIERLEREKQDMILQNNKVNIG